MGKRDSVAGIEIEGVLGRGASATVFLGYQRRYRRKVAVKVLEPTYDELLDKLFRAESTTLGRFSSHPNILTLFEAGITDDGRPYIVTEYLPGGTLAERVRLGGPLPWARVLDIGVQLAGALESAHREGVLHGDLKPQNILVGRMDQPVLADFGIARMMVGTTGTFLGALTPLHAAPELLDGAIPSVASDVYGLGSTLFELIEGESAVGRYSDTPLAVVSRIAAGERSAIKAQAVPGTLATMIDRCMDADPASRPSSAAELGEQLREIQSAEDLGATPLPVIEPLATSAPRFIDLTDPVVVSPADTLSPPRRPGLRRRSVVGALVLVAVLAAILVRTIAGPADRGKGPDGEAAAPTTESVSRSTTVSTLPSSPVSGIQPGVEHVQGERDQSEDLATQLGEEGIIFAQLGSAAGSVTEEPLLSWFIDGLPARFHYQGFNNRSTTCSGMMTRELQADALWERGLNWDGGRLHVSVGRFATQDQAHQMFTAMSLNAGVDTAGCRNMAEFGPQSFDADYAVTVQEFPMTFSLAGRPDYNSWASTDLYYEGVTYPMGLRVLVERGDLLVDLILFDSGTLPVRPDQVVPDILNQILLRTV